MSVRVTGVAACQSELREIETLLNSPKPMEGVVEDVRAGVLEKTALGHDYRGRNFEPYSDAYKDKRKKAGLTTKPNLNVTGTMLDAISTKVVSPTHGQVYVAAASDGRINADVLAEIHNVGVGKQKRREFMNITKAAIEKLVKKYFDDPIKAIVQRYR